MSAPLPPSEPSLRIFISSRIDDVLKSIREEASIDLNNDLAASYVFEYASADSRTAQETYFDIFVWVTDGTSSPATASEVRRAIKSEKKILGFILDSKPQDDLTDCLVAEVQRIAKTQDSSAADFRKHFLAAIHGEVIRGFRGQASIRKSAYLDRELAASRARCQASFELLGLSQSIANELIDDSSVGYIPVAPEGQVTILTAEAGAGKSLSAERLFQNAFIKITENDPLPVMILGRNLTGSLNEALHDLNIKYRTHLTGLCLIIDGIDESSTNPQDLYMDARALISKHPRSNALLTSRPLPVFAELPSLRVPRLDDRGAMALMERSGEAPRNLINLPPQLREAVHLPLYALLMGKALKDRIAVGAPHALIEHLVSRAIQKSKTPKDLQLELLNLAIRTTDHGGNIDIRGCLDSAALLSTGLVASEGGTLGFTLAVVQQHFAAIALQNDEFDIRELSGDMRHALRWRFALAVAVASASEPIRNRILEQVGEWLPQLIAWVISESLALPNASQIQTLPPRAIAAKQLNLSTDVLASCLQSKLTQSLDKRVTSEPMITNVETSDNVIHYSAERVVPIRSDWQTSIPGKSIYNITRRAGGSGWNWIIAKDEITNQLQDVLNRKLLPIPPTVQCERDWEIVNAVSLGLPQLEYASVEAIRTRFEEFIEFSNIRDARRLNVNSVATNPIELTNVLAKIASGSLLISPWPERDEVPGQFVWNGFSKDRLINRTKEIYAAAFESYQWVAKEVLPNIAPLLSRYCIRPAKYYLTLQGYSTSYGPTIIESLEPLPLGASDEIECVWDEGLDFFQQLHACEHYRLSRAETEFVGHSHSHRVLDIFGTTPATDLMYTWLKADLKIACWIK
jgi:hypothetical protein